MGASKSGGYKKMPATTASQNRLLEQFLSQAGPLLQESAQGFRGFGAGGQAAKDITSQANQNFSQQTVPSILNAFGSNSKGSSALNQALAAGASDLNSNIAAQLAQMQLSSAQGLGNLGTGQAQLGTQTNQFAYAPKQQPFWQSALLGGIGAAGQVGSGFFGGGK